jgi:hypothetical protein
MQCSSCGTTLPPGARNCPACGTAVFASNPSEQTFISLPGSQPESSTPASTSPYPPGQPAGPFPNPYEQPGYPLAPQPPLYLGSQQPQYTPPPLPPTQPQKARRGGLSRGVTILLIVLALLIMFSGFGLIYYSTVYHPNQLHMQATATVQTQQTGVAQSTATANAQATGTAVAIVNATATAQAQATANAVATATALQGIYNSATQGGPVLNDSLSSNTGSNWEEDQAQGGGGCAFTGGAYHASIDQKGFYFACAAQNTNFTNFAFQVQMAITKGDAGGIFFHGNRNAFHFYLLSIAQDGTFDLFISKDQNHSTDLLFGNSPAIKKGLGQTNLVTVVVRGNTIYFYVNKQYAGSVIDTTFTSGQIGVFVDAHTTATDVAFKNARAWKL